MASKARSANPVNKQLIPDTVKYRYEPSAIKEASDRVAEIMGKKKKNATPAPNTNYETANLVHALCNATLTGTWNDECEHLMIDHLPVQEHHKALLSHSLFVTVVGTVVARAIEEVSGKHGISPKPMALLSDRHFIRDIICHDSSKTSTMEVAACSGLMALHMDKLTLSEKPDPEGPLKDLCDADKESELKTMMANFGFKHHYEHNRHHPEHYCGKSMADIQVVHAVVDGLACILERKHVSSIKQWLDTFHAGGLRGRNLTLVQAVLQALDETLTETDFLNLTDFKRTIQMLIGESPVWSQIVMSVACKKNAPGTEEAITDFTHCCFTKK